MNGNFAANTAIQNADVIINIGSRFDDRIIGNPNLFAPRANEAYKTGNGGIVHVNIEASEFNQNVKAHVCVHSTSEEFLRSILCDIMYKSRDEWFKQINEWQLRHPFSFTIPEDGLLRTQMVVSEINDQLQQQQQQIQGPTENNKKKQECVDKKQQQPYFITTGVGNHQMMTAQFIKWTCPNTLLTSGSMGVMGVSLPYAIGAQIAHPGHTVISIDGDGSFNMTMGELKTVADYSLPIKIAIMNDGEMSMVKAWEHVFLEQRYSGSPIKQTLSYPQLAQAFGIKSMVCDSQDELRNTMAEFLAYDDGPVLCDFRVKADFCLPLVKPGHALDDMFVLVSDFDLMI